jgi:hypothetical protein
VDAVRRRREDERITALVAVIHNLCVVWNFELFRKSGPEAVTTPRLARSRP